MNTFQFRDYIFKNNPARISVSDARSVVTHMCPGSAEISQDMGKKARVVTCSGSFWGDSFSEAVAQLEELRKRSGDVGMLYLPGVAPFPARLTELSFDAVGDGRIIPYTMRFLEELSE